MCNMLKTQKKQILYPHFCKPHFWNLQPFQGIVNGTSQNWQPFPRAPYQPHAKNNQQSAPVHPWSMAPSSFASSNSGHRKDCLGCSCSCLLLTCTTIFERLAERYSIRSEEGNKSQCSCDVVLFVWAGFLSRQHSLVHSPIQKACKKLRCPNSRFSLPPRTSLARQGCKVLPAWDMCKPRKTEMQMKKHCGLWWFRRGSNCLTHLQSRQHLIKADLSLQTLWNWKTTCRYM